MNDKQPIDAPVAPLPQPLGVLAWIAAYKLLKAVLAILGGLAAFQLGDRNLIELVHRWLPYFGLDPAGKVGTRLLARAAHLNPHRLQVAGAILFLYAALYCLEGAGLFFERKWAEWLTIIQTSILIPIEINELIRRPGPFKALALITSLAVVVYLLWRLLRTQKIQSADAPPV